MTLPELTLIPSAEVSPEFWAPWRKSYEWGFRGSETGVSFVLILHYLTNVYWTPIMGHIQCGIGEGSGNPLQHSCLEKSHGWRSLVGSSPWGRKESDTAEQLHFLSVVAFGVGNGSPPWCSCLEHPMDRGACWAAVYEVSKSQTQISNWYTHTHTHTHTQCGIMGRKNLLTEHFFFNFWNVPTYLSLWALTTNPIAIL